MPELGLALLQQLADAAVVQRRFADAAHGYYTLAMATIKVSARLAGAPVPRATLQRCQADASASSVLHHRRHQLAHPSPGGRLDEAGDAALRAFRAHYEAAELYYAYHLIHTTAHQPFKTVDDGTLFNAARCVRQGVTRLCVERCWRVVG
jgi:hypothetical protein